MALAEYRRKRHFDKTSEPAGRAAKRRSGRALKFVVQKHAARRLYYDFRLELDGVLVSWAVPKGPSLDPAQKRLAVHVEDHPLEYGSFEGRIPEGEYGAGEVIVWDKGTWTPDGDARIDLKRGRLEFRLTGKKLNGGWRLLRLKGKANGDRDNWLLMKRRDESARSDSEFDVLEELPESVKSGKRLASDNGTPSPSAERRQAAKKRLRTPKRRHRGPATSLDPADYPLALATLVKEPPEGDQWLHEIKLDGYRLLVLVDSPAGGRRVRLITRSGLDWTGRYPQVAQAAQSLAVDSAVLDGELVALDEQGVSQFQLLQNLAANRDQPLVFYAFDLLHLDGEDWRRRPLSERKRRLAELLQADRHGPIRYSDHVTAQGPAFLAECCRRGLEGIICKRADRPYSAGRSLDWLKVKCLGREELVIGGFTDSPAVGRPIGALLLGYYRDQQLVYAGRVGTGFDGKVLADLHRRLVKQKQAPCPFENVPARERRDGHWVRPELVAQIEFGSWTDAGIVRHASFQGLREDKPAYAVGPPESLKFPPASDKTMNKRKQQAHLSSRAKGKPRTTPPAKRRRSTRQPAKSGSSGSAVVLTNPQRMLYPDVGLTKQTLADYYAQYADVLLPHVGGRPLSMLRCPEGIDESCFFQKHAAAGTPQALRRIPIEEKDGVEEYLVVDDANGLRAMAQMSILEIHPWGSPAKNIEQPDRLIFDLDPGPKVDWQAVVDAAVHVRDVLAHLDLETFVKTSGGKGLHVVAPLTGPVTWPTLKQFARAIAEHIAQQQPELYTAKLRNDRGSTAVAPYSPRARSGAPLSMPVTWEDLATLESAAQFTIPTAMQQADKRRNPWRDFFKIKQKLPKFALAGQ
jgi:bifunctional non-homologous end joining protein LigD